MKFHVGTFVLDYVKFSVVQSLIPAHPSLKMKKPAKDVSGPPQKATLDPVPKRSSLIGILSHGLA